MKSDEIAAIRARAEKATPTARLERRRERLEFGRWLVAAGRIGEGE